MACAIVAPVVPSPLFAERGVSVPREVLQMVMFKHFAARFDGWKYLASRYPNRVALGKMDNERRVYALLAALRDDELALEFSAMTRPTPAYLEAAGLCEEVAAEVHAGRSTEKTLAYLARRGILPPQFSLLAAHWWNRPCPSY